MKAFCLSKCIIMGVLIHGRYPMGWRVEHSTALGGFLYPNVSLHHFTIVWEHELQARNEITSLSCEDGYMLADAEYILKEWCPNELY